VSTLFHEEMHKKVYSILRIIYTVFINFPPVDSSWTKVTLTLTQGAIVHGTSGPKSGMAHKLFPKDYYKIIDINDPVMEREAEEFKKNWEKIVDDEMKKQKEEEEKNKSGKCSGGK